MTTDEIMALVSELVLTTRRTASAISREAGAADRCAVVQYLNNGRSNDTPITHRLQSVCACH